MAIAGGLLSKGLPILADVVMAKGKEFVEEKTGIKLSADPQGNLNLPPEQIVILKKYEMDNAVELQKIALENRKVALQELRQQMGTEEWVEELRTKTIPWVDALHKMGRLISNWIIVAYAIISILTKHVITQEEVFLLGVGNGIYQFIKGKGQK